MQSSTTTILIWSIAGSILVLLIFLAFIVYLIKVYTTKQNEFITTIKLNQIENEKKILSARIEVQEETMQKISQEIHDNVNQLLTLAKMNLNSTENIPIKDFNSKATISKELISTAITELTNISRTLNAGIILDYGIARSLEAEADRINQIEKVKINVNVSPHLPELTNEIQLIIYRIFQEATRNAIFHGNASEIFTTLCYFNGYINFAIIDNGCGFDINSQLTTEKIAHQGLSNIKKRVKLVNGDLKIKSERGKGTSINISIPT